MSEVTQMLTAIERTGVPLSAVWVFDFNSQDATHNITLENPRAYMLRAISEANRRMRAATAEKQAR